MTRRRTILAGGALLLAAGAAAILWLSWPPVARSDAPPDTRAATAEIVRGNLRDTRKVSGTLGYGDLSTLRPRATSGMVTWLAPVGSTVERGQPLVAIDGQPVILLYGIIPQHRTLRFEPGAAPIWVERETAETEAEAATLALTLEQERLKDAESRMADAEARLADGLAASPATAAFIQLAGSVSTAEAKLARVRELSAAELTPAIDIAAAEAELAAARANLDSAIRSVRKDLSAATLDAATARVAVAQAEAKRATASDLLLALRARVMDNSDIAQLADNLTALGYDGDLAQQVTAWQQAAGLPVTGTVGPDQVVVAPGPVHIAAQTASVGETLTANSSALIDYSSTEKLVAVPLSVGDQSLAAVGSTVSVILPDDSTVDGIISEVGSIVTDGTIEITITIAGQSALAGLEVAAVDVEFVSDSRDDVLSVPIAALLALPEGGFAVEVVTAGVSHLVPVDTGLFAGGRVEVSGDGITDGARVGVPG